MRMSVDRPSSSPGAYPNSASAARLAHRIVRFASKAISASWPPSSTGRMSAADDAIRPLIAGKIRQDLIERNWPDILRLSASAAVGAVAPSRILKRLASYPRQNDLALALNQQIREALGGQEPSFQDQVP